MSKTKAAGARAQGRSGRAPVAVVSALSPARTKGWVTLGGLRLPCALGRTGMRAVKREGDGATPVGRWRLAAVRYRADRLLRPRTRLPVQPIRPADGWCDAADDRNYNRPVRHPYPVSAEVMWRPDSLYDIVVILDCNMCPRIRGRGSAIFMHLARPGYAPTAGCVALGERNLRLLLARAGRTTALLVRP